MPRRMNGECQWKDLVSELERLRKRAFEAEQALSDAREQIAQRIDKLAASQRFEGQAVIYRHCAQFVRGLPIP